MVIVPGLGPGGRKFESYYLDKKFFKIQTGVERVVEATRLGIWLRYKGVLYMGSNPMPLTKAVYGLIKWSA